MAPAQEIEAVVGGDAMQPGAHRGLGLEAVGMLIDLEEDLLEGVFGLERVAQQTVSYLVEPALMAANDFRQSGLVAFGHSPE